MSMRLFQKPKSKAPSPDKATNVDNVRWPESARLHIGKLNSKDIEDRRDFHSQQALAQTLRGNHEKAKFHISGVEEVDKHKEAKSQDNKIKTLTFERKKSQMWPDFTRKPVHTLTPAQLTARRNWHSLKAGIASVQKKHDHAKTHADGVKEVDDHIQSEIDRKKKEAEAKKKLALMKSKKSK